MPDDTTNDLEVYRTILDNAPDAVIWADSEGIVRYWNRGAEELLGFAAADAVGQSMDFFIPENLRARHWEGYDRVLAGGEIRYGRRDLLKVPALHADGTRRSVEFTLQSIDHPTFGKLFVAFMRDATAAFNEMRELRKQLAAAQVPPSSV